MRSLIAALTGLACAPLLAAPNVQLAKTPDGATITLGNVATFDYVVTNTGSSDAGFPQLVDLLPGGGGIFWSTPTSSCGISGDQGAQVLECDFDTLAPGGQATATVSGTPTSCATLASTADVFVFNNTPSTVSDGGVINVTSDLCRPLFVIGDGQAHAIGDVVNFWGAQLWKYNAMSGVVGNGVASFKGYVSDSDIFCGPDAMWESRPGNSAKPPDALPVEVMIIVTDSVRKDGPDIVGPIRQILLVKPDTGYGPSPGHRGNGTVTGVLCPAPR